MAWLLTRCRPVSFGVAAIFCLSLVLFLPGWSSAQTSSATEDDIRAAMVSHLPLFVNWPPGKTDVASPQFHVCLLGADPIAPVLEAAFHKAAVSDMPVVFSHVNVSDKLDKCHLLYIGAGARGNFAKLIPALQQMSVLTVSEQPIENVSGEVIGLPLEENHVRVEVNLAVAQSSRLSISSRLLHLASVVKRP